MKTFLRFHILLGPSTPFYTCRYPFIVPHCQSYGGDDDLCDERRVVLLKKSYKCLGRGEVGGPHPGSSALRKHSLFRTPVPAPITACRRVTGVGLLTLDPSCSQLQDRCIIPLHIFRCRQNCHRCLENVSYSLKIDEVVVIVRWDQGRSEGLKAPLPGGLGCQDRGSAATQALSPWRPRSPPLLCLPKHLTRATMTLPRTSQAGAVSGVLPLGFQFPAGRRIIINAWAGSQLQDRRLWLRLLRDTRGILGPYHKRRLVNIPHYSRPLSLPFRFSCTPIRSFEKLRLAIFETSLPDG